NPDAVLVDGTGIGWGVHDRLNQLGCPNLVGVDFGARADRTDASDAAARYANKRAEMWGFMKEWLKAGSLLDDTELLADLKAVDYGYDASDAILLERKDDMRRRGLASPDDGDALALTFALSGRQARQGRGAPLRGRAPETEEVGRVIPRAAVWARGRDLSIPSLPSPALTFTPFHRCPVLALLRHSKGRGSTTYLRTRPPCSAQ
ncbi:MAG TPA: hypothetical protein VJ454_13375, partial [Steroidobacteraceae bacterium]|nr:hypothetical protein [Steroidobacteraceae bacterium]